MPSIDDMASESARGGESLDPQEATLRGGDETGEWTAFDATAPPPPRDAQETTRRGLETLGERTKADLRGVIEQLDGAWRRREEAAKPIRSLGPYTDLVEIGRGGMGVVYRARDSRRGGFVALKVPSPDWIGEPSLRLRFLREARIVSALDHPGILSHLDSGEVDGRCYIAGEYCDGPDLAAWLKRRTAAVPPEAAARLVAALAAAVAHAHDRGILHRDLKPSNVLLPGGRDSTDPMTLAPRLTDFGLAKLVDPLDDEADPAPLALTRTGVLLGSPPYMAPEQAAGNLGAIGPWTDVYGLGAILYEVLTGRPPFRGESPSETLRQAREDEPIPVRALRAGVPRALETIALKCLEKAPALRYASAALLADDLDRFVQGRSIVARSARPRERLRRWRRRRPLLARFLAAWFTGLALIMSGFVAWNLSLQRSNAIITRERERADQNVYDANLQLASKALEAEQVGRAQLILRDMIPQAGEVDRRDFAWGHLWRHSRREAQLISAGEAELTGLAQSADGRLLAATDAEGILRLIDLKAEETVWSHRWERPVQLGHPAFSADGRLVAVAVVEQASHPAREVSWVELRSAETGEFLGLGAPREARRVEHVGFLERQTIELGSGLDSGGRGSRRADAWSGARREPRPPERRGEPRATPADAALDQAALLTVATWARSSSGETSVRFATREVVQSREDALRLHSVSRDFAWLDAAPDGASYAAPGLDGRPALFDARTNAVRFPLADAPDGLNARAFFAPDGSRVAMTRGDEAMIWDAATGRLLHRVAGADGSGSLVTVALQPGGTAALLRSASEEVRLVDPARGLDERIFAPADGAPGIETSRLAFTPDGRDFFINRTEYMEADAFQLRAAADGKLRSESPGRQIGFIGFWLPQRERGGGDGPTLIYNIRRYLWRWNGSPGPAAPAVERLKAHHGEIWDVAYSPDGAIRATAGDDTDEPRTIKLCDARSGRLIRGWKGHEAIVTDLDFAPDGRRLASASLAQTGPVRVWECPSGRQLASLKLPGRETARCVRFDPTGTRLIVGGNGGTVWAWDARDFSMLWERRNRDDRIHDAAFGPGGDRVATASDLGFVRVYDAATGALAFEFRSPGSVLTVAYDPTGRILAAGDREGSVFLFDAQTNRPLRTIRGDDRQLYGLAFSPDGKTLAVGGHGRIVQLYDSETGNELLSLKGHQAQVNALAFSPDGLTLASADHAGVVFLWRAFRGPVGRSD